MRTGGVQVLGFVVELLFLLLECQRFRLQLRCFYRLLLLLVIQKLRFELAVTVLTSEIAA